MSENSEEVENKSAVSSSFSAAYDSGQFSCSNLSDWSQVPGGCFSFPQFPSSTDVEFQENCSGDDVNSTSSNRSLSSNRQIRQILKEKDQSLFLVLQDNRKLKSELERISKSEKWYKSECKKYQRSRLEYLERYYLNERKFVQENKLLQEQNVKLESQLAELEKKLRTAIENTKTPMSQHTIKSNITDFQLERKNQTIEELEDLVEMLRRQKQGLLEDLKNSSEQCEDKILIVQRLNAELEHENKQLTKRYIELAKIKRELESSMEEKENNMEILQRKLEDKSEELNRLSLALCVDNSSNHSEEIKKLELEISSLGLEAAENRKYFQMYEEEVRNNETLLFRLKEHQNLEELSSSKSERLQFEFIQISEKYKQVCKMLETTKFELDMRCVEIERLKFEKSADTFELTNVRETVNELRKKNSSLELQVLKITNENDKTNKKLQHVSGESNSLEKIRFLQALLEQQSLKVSRNEEEQQEWQTLLIDLNKAQRLAEKANVDSELKSTVIYEQNAQIEALEGSLRKTQLENSTFQEELSKLRAQNESSIEEFNSLYINQRETFRKLEKSNLADIEFLNEEKLRLETDLQKLQKNNSKFSDTSETDEIKHLRALNKVLEIEQVKKIARFEIHIRNLLKNVKSYKKNFEILQDKHNSLVAKYKTLQVKNMHLFNNGNELKIARQNLTNLDRYKRQNNELKENLSNLMDDYKKILQPMKKHVSKDYSDIYELMNFSNNYVPKLENLENSISDIRQDVKSMTKKNVCAIDGTRRVSSLLDELQQATEGSY